MGQAKISLSQKNKRRGLFYAVYIIKTNKTLREAAKTMGVSHTTIYRYIELLEDCAPLIYKRVHEIYEEHRKRFKGGWL